MIKGGLHVIKWRLHVIKVGPHVIKEGRGGGFQLVDEVKERVFTVLKEGLPDLVVWNPWIDKARAMSDFGDEEYKVLLSLLNPFPFKTS